MEAMTVRILFAGDVMGAAGRRALRLALQDFRTAGEVDAVVVNGENAAGGMGITAAIFTEFRAQGVDVVTAGNHVWDQREILQFIDTEPRLLRPYNAPPGTPGAGWVSVPMPGGWQLGVLNLMGRLFMHFLVRQVKGTTGEGLAWRSARRKWRFGRVYSPGCGDGIQPAFL
jgi:calcineurin-like phosphoesterase